MKKVLLVGSGAREHAIVQALKSGQPDCEIYTYGSSINPGIKKLSADIMIGTLKHNASIVCYATQKNIDWAIVGPEAPLSQGLVDALSLVGIPCIGPTQDLAQIESSKSFTRDLLAEFGIEASPQYKVFDECDGIKEWVHHLDNKFVIKPDGLTGGKGVKVQGDHFESPEQGIKMIEECIAQGDTVVIEEKLIGQEFSLMSLCDGDHLMHLPVVQDHKRAYNDDIGPNTGGMGSYSCQDSLLPFLNKQDIERAQDINQQTADALRQKFGEGYRGILYGGFIVTKYGVKLIEYNARFGDPEAMNVLPLFADSQDSEHTKFFDVCECMINGNLNEIEPNFKNHSTVCKYVVPQGYPDNPTKNEMIDVSSVDENKVQIYYASVDQKEDGLFLCGSRAIALVGQHDDLYEAEKMVEKEINKIQGPVFHRQDIGTQSLVKKRITMMEQLRTDVSIKKQNFKKQINLAVFASTNGTDLQAIIDTIKSGQLREASLKFVLSNKKDCYAMERAKMAGIKTVFINPKGKTREEFDTECLQVCKQKKIDLIVMIGYMRIITSAILCEYENRIMNIHPSLLPKYPGMDLDVHKAVLDNNEKETGCTLHFATKEVDEGPIIIQEKVRILDNDTPASLKQRVQEKEQEVLIRGIKMFCEENIKIMESEVPDQISNNCNQLEPMKKRALISVSNKDGIVDFAKGLEELGWEIISTGGTYKALKESGVKYLSKVEDLTDFPEIMDGRVKTLHPKIYGGLLADRSKPNHLEQARENNIPMIDMVVCNLYPFESVSKDKSQNHENVIENIDIGGVSLLRAAAKNYRSVMVITNPKDYEPVLSYFRRQKELSKELALKAFKHTSEYDQMIAGYLNGQEDLNLHFNKMYDVRYGENWHQKASFYKDEKINKYSIVNAEILHGKKLSFNNLLDADAALNLIREFEGPAAAVLKHTNPCGCAQSIDINEAFKNAYEADSVSAFGGIIVINRECTREIAEYVNDVFVEIVIAPSFDKVALEILKQKKNIRIVQTGPIEPLGREDVFKDYRKINGGVLEQEYNSLMINKDDLKYVSDLHPSEDQTSDLLFAWKVVKHVKSNAIVIVRDGVTLGIGAGQMSRVDAADLAIKKANEDTDGAVVASDGFFPFRDSLDRFSECGIDAVIEPGGSMKDDDVIAAANEHDMALVFTGYRVFRH